MKVKPTLDEQLRDLAMRNWPDEAVAAVKRSDQLEKANKKLLMALEYCLDDFSCCSSRAAYKIAKDIADEIAEYNKGLGELK